MKTKFTLLAVTLLTAAGQSVPDLESVRVRLGGLAYPRSAMDSQGGIVSLPAAPLRIVSMASATDEYLYQIARPETIVGISNSAFDKQFSAVLEKMNAFPPSPVKDVASVLRLKPDLVLGTDSAPPEMVHALEDAGVPVFRLFTNVTKLDQVAANILTIGYITGNDDGGRRELSRFQKEFAEIAEQCRNPHPVARIYGVSMTGFSYGDQTLFQDIMRVVGATNVAAENGMHTYDKADRKTVAQWNPDWIFTWSVPGKAEQERSVWMNDPSLGKTSAAKKRQIHVSDAKDVLPLSSLVTTFARTIANATCK
jgi:iron complex transport system substrate-binding protein